MSHLPEHIHYQPGMCTFVCENVRGVTAQQHYDAFSFFERFFAAYPVDRIIEIGTAAGGLSMWFRVATKLPVTTYDIHEFPLYAKLRELGVDTRKKDVFHPEHHAELSALIRAPGRVLLLCDGGYKIREFNTFSDDLKNGDYIMAHDYCEDRETYFSTMQPIWKWWEIGKADISQAMNRNSLTEIMPESKFVALLVARCDRA